MPFLRSCLTCKKITPNLAFSNKINFLLVDPVYEEKVCLVTEWTEWSDCSRTCGYGMKVRTRNVTKWTGNIPCPELKVEQLCGSMKKCNWNHFR